MHGASSVTFKGLAERLKYLNSLQLLVSNGSEFEFFIFSLIYFYDPLFRLALFSCTDICGT